MGVGYFSVAQRLRLKGRAMRISQRFDAGGFELEDLATGRHEDWSLHDLLGQWSAGDLIFQSHQGYDQKQERFSDLLNAYSDAFRNTYPEHAWQKARKKLEFVFRLQKRPIYKESLEPLIDEIWRDDSIWKTIGRFERVPAWTSVAGWIRRYTVADRDVRALIDKTHLKGNREGRFPQEVIDIVDDFIELMYMDPKRVSRKEVLSAVGGYIAKQNQARPASEALPTPSDKVLKRRIATLDAYDLYASRHGLAAAKLKFRTVGEGVFVEKALDRVEIDHHKMNVFVLDDELLLPLGRPWLTLLLDACTRYVVGFYIGFEEPSGVSVARAIRHALAPKMCSDGVVNPWDAWGVWDTLVADNGLELHGESVERGCAQFGVKVQYCPRRKPWYKGKIERYFRTVDTQFTGNLDGKTFESITARGDYDPSKHAVITLSTLKKILEKWIVDIYHQTTHRGIGKTPAQAWEESLTNVDRYLPDSSVLFDAAFSRVERRRLDKDGIDFDWLRYQCRDLEAIRKKYGDVDVDIHVMDDDLGWITVCVPDSNVVIRVEAVDQNYAKGLTRWQHKMCKRYQKRKYEVENQVLSLYEAKMGILDLIQEDLVKIKRKTRSRQARFKNDASLASKPPTTNATPSATPTGAALPDDVASTPATETVEQAMQAPAPSPAAKRNVPKFAPITVKNETEVAA